MKQPFAFGCAAFAGLVSSSLAIEPPDTPAPIPPQATPEAAAVEEPAAPPVEMPQAGAEAPAAAVRAYLGVAGSQLP